MLYPKIINTNYTEEIILRKNNTKNQQSKKTNSYFI